jgi:hypothetical protein
MVAQQIEDGRLAGKSSNAMELSFFLMAALSCF